MRIYRQLPVDGLMVAGWKIYYIAPHNIQVTLILVINEVSFPESFCRVFSRRSPWTVDVHGSWIMAAPTPVFLTLTATVVVTVIKILLSLLLLLLYTLSIFHVIMY